SPFILPSIHRMYDHLSFDNSLHNSVNISNSAALVSIHYYILFQLNILPWNISGRSYSALFQNGQKVESKTYSMQNVWRV
ncbi:MAG TPA: hypothetical protein VKA09_03515, partial [Nitrososphaeraceae archaeon]|nr:hypothetical protein [Nitrososphaeraceae archaeon]